MKQNKYIRFLLFLVVNFLALAIGILLMKDGPRTEWYLSLNKAPWTPAGWVFGASWSTIMLLFAFYMTKLSLKFPFLDKKLTILFSVQWILNVGWNYFFFNQHLTLIGLVVITLLWLLIGYFTFKNLRELKGITLFILPYLIWMTIATSLNAYIVFYN
ncbi:TspO/MBR family protein [Tenacibaculum finnmarkense]|uniref:TspO/MBR family protein n=1 Tax=Tenacibaculum finnmarkense TaxID=2781243 RepID=UPI00187B1AA2|nr:TspO/MBR family protein [Tenacibaculum finnmarkense]MBE7659957.1 tryptophan-rich sensory protein [Tenacibaculum finnmarkense genomovar finnmarkense]MCG8251643.1 tryptophan-rich sensory protein [Tenacibaculum finnmarkense genomovar finnmarkense]MCG8815171.1 tryptophan-rich sensory protein [Tenacibaculum finnmarkense]MCG8820196.1 tryptophan-rich sensory protein [Tenacibaculum finnmarkense]